MSVNSTTRQPTLVINGVDLSQCLVRFEGSDNHLDQSGFISFTGQIVLAPYPGLSVELDDRKNPSQFCRGVPITLSIPDSTGTVRVHPRGALRILKPQYIITESGIEQRLQVGDLIALLNSKEPTDPNEAQNFITQQGKTAAEIIGQLLNKAGWAGGIGGGLPATTYNYPIPLSGSYLGIVGKLLYANNVFGWVDSTETIQFVAATIQANPTGLDVVIGQDEILYQRLAGGETPVETVRAVGTEMVTRPSTGTLTTITETYGTAASVDPTQSTNQIIVTQGETEAQVWNSQTGILTKTTTIVSPYGLVIPAGLGNTGLFFNIIASITVETSTYEQDGVQLSQVGGPDQPTLYQYQEGKLKSKITQTYQPRGTYLSEYCQANTSYVPGDITDPVLVKTEQDIYQYDVLARISSINSTTQQLAIILLNGTGEDWSAYNFPPENLVNSQVTTQTWTQLNKTTWRYKSESLKNLVVVDPSAVVFEDGSSTISNKLNLILSSPDSVDRTSNAGQSTPPATERCPPLYTIEENQIQQLASFSDDCASNLVQRERTYSVDLLASRISPAIVPGSPTLPTNATPGEADTQLQAIAQREGQLLRGRYKGQEIALRWTDAVFNYTPLYPITATEPDGIIRYYLADGANWALTTTEIGWHFDGIWVGTKVGTEIVPPYIMPSLSYGGIAFGGISTFFPYPLTPQSSATKGGLGFGGKGYSTLFTKGGMGFGATSTIVNPSINTKGGMGFGGKESLSAIAPTKGGVGFGGKGYLTFFTKGGVAFGGRENRTVPTKGGVGFGAEFVGLTRFSQGGVGFGESTRNTSDSTQGGVGFDGKSTKFFLSRGGVAFGGAGADYWYPLATSAMPGIITIGPQFTITNGVLGLASSGALSIGTTTFSFVSGYQQYLSITLPKVVAILAVSASPCRFRLYIPASSSANYQSSDYSRPPSIKPSQNSGVITDLDFTSVLSAFTLCQMAFGYSATNNYPYTMDAAAAGTMTITYLTMVA